MRYYQIRNSLDKNIIGKEYPQVQDVIVPTSWEDPRFIGNFTKTRTPENVLVPEAVLNKKSKVTDLISCSAVGLSTNLLVSDQLKFIIEVGKHYGIDFFETSLKTPVGDDLKFWIIHSYESYYEALDLERTSFYWSDYTMALRPDKRVQFSSLRQLLDAYKEVDQKSNLPMMQREILVIDKVSLKEGVDIDFFTIYGIKEGGKGYYISERLKEAIEKDNCTGIVFEAIS